MVERLVVIGGDAAGMSCAAQARRRRTEDDLAIVAFEKGRFTSYSACGIPYWVGEVVDERDELIARSPEEHRRRGIDVRLRQEVVAIDLERGAVLVRDLDGGGETWEGYDQLMVATGAEPKVPPLPGVDGDGIHGVQTLEDGDALLRDLEGHDVRRVVVVGGGYIGLEMAEAAVMRGLDVTLVERRDCPMHQLDPDMGGMVADAMRDVGIEIRLGEQAEAFDLAEDGRVQAVVTSDGVLPTDLVILGLGVRPRIDIASEAGIEIGRAGGITVDPCQRTSADQVWAAGDCAEKFHRVTRRPAAVALGTHANKQGRVAGINLGGGYATFPGIVGTAATKICAVEVARTGLSEEEATGAGFRHVSARVSSTTRAGYYPGASPLVVKVTAELRSGRLLGAQIVGREGAGKRIDTFATALWNGMTVDDLVNVDLSYAPPVAPLWDPVLIGARKAWQAVQDSLPNA